MAAALAPSVNKSCAADISVISQLPTLIRVRVRLQGHAPCVGCSVDAFIMLSGLRYDVQFSPVLTDKKGMLTLHFPDASIRGGMTLWSMVTSVNGVSSITVNTTTCTWGGLGRDATIKQWCAGRWQQASIANPTSAGTGVRPMVDSVALPLCASYAGAGRWCELGQLGGERVPLGHWVENGCHSLRRSAVSRLNLRVAFVGDSVLRNLFYEWCSPGRWVKDVPYTPKSQITGTTKSTATIQSSTAPMITTAVGSLTARADRTDGAVGRGSRR